MKQLLLLAAILVAFSAGAQRRGWGGGGYYHPSYHSVFSNSGCYSRGYDRPYYHSNYSYGCGNVYGGFGYRRSYCSPSYSYYRPYCGPSYSYYRPYARIGFGFGIGIGCGYPYVPPLVAPAMSYNYAPAYASVGQQVYTSPAPAPIPPVNASASSISPADFERAKSSIYSKSSDNTRLTIAEEVANSNYLTSTQVREIMGLMNTEDARLDFAKFAYAHTLDTNNYYVVNDAFSAEASVNDLNNYINRR